MTKRQPFSKNLKIIIACIILALIATGIYALSKSEINLSANEFSRLDTSKIKNAYIYENMLYFSIEKKDYKILAEPRLINELLKHSSIEQKSEFDYSIILALIMLFAFLYYLNFIKNLNKTQRAQGGLNNLAKPEFRLVFKTDCSFDNVIGQQRAKQELRKLSSVFKSSAQTKGVLLTGASGVGKTMLARALANESGVCFLYQSASSFNEIFVGLGAKRVRELFEQARKIAPCIVFIDEIDALGKQRGNALASDSENTLNELLTQIDGFLELKRVLIIAATNRADVLDPALLRRFDRKIHFSLPTHADRLEFLRQMVAKDLISPDYDLDYLAFISRGFSGANYKSLENELSFKPRLSLDELVLEIFELKFGISDGVALSPDEERVQAIYQAGKILLARLTGARLVYADFFNFEYFYPNENVRSFSEIKNEIKILQAGRLANELILGETYNNFAKDEEKLAKLSENLTEFQSGNSRSECEQYLRAYSAELVQIADELQANKRIIFKDK